MRGFDPASEDDMDDNGLSRYMENNDDEGWDLRVSIMAYTYEYPRLAVASAG